jgi:hypothetical protein
MILLLKENLLATWVKSISFDAHNEINTSIESYSLYEKVAL